MVVPPFCLLQGFLIIVHKGASSNPPPPLTQDFSVLISKRCFSPSSVSACEFPGGTDGLLRVEERLRGRLLRRDVAVRHRRFEVTDLTVDVEAQALSKSIAYSNSMT
jgi:hypothetical protein